jgi:uncharacterized protein YdcH (DUF465 family)
MNGNNQLTHLTKEQKNNREFVPEMTVLKKGKIKIKDEIQNGAKSS